MPNPPYLGLLAPWFVAGGQVGAWGELALAFGLVPAPVLVHNWLAGSEFPLFTSSAGINCCPGDPPRTSRICAQSAFASSAAPSLREALWEELLAQGPGDERLRARVDSLRRVVRGGRR